MRCLHEEAKRYYLYLHHYAVKKSSQSFLFTQDGLHLAKRPIKTKTV